MMYEVLKLNVAEPRVPYQQLDRMALVLRAIAAFKTQMSEKSIVRDLIVGQDKRGAIKSLIDIRRDADEWTRKLLASWAWPAVSDPVRGADKIWKEATLVDKQFCFDGDGDTWGSVSVGENVRRTIFWNKGKGMVKFAVNDGKKCKVIRAGNWLAPGADLEVVPDLNLLVDRAGFLAKRIVWYNTRLPSDDPNACPNEKWQIYAEGLAIPRIP
ncbi:MAG: hypothetical protein ACRERS_10880, partial [Methylococcales bacterium]